MHPFIRFLFASQRLNALFFIAFVCGINFGINAMQPQPGQLPRPHQPWNLILFNVCASSNNISADVEELQALSAHIAPIIVRKSALKKIIDDLISFGLSSSAPNPTLNRINSIVSNWRLFNTNKGDYCILVPAPDTLTTAQVTQRAQELGLLVQENEYGGLLQVLISRNDFPYNNTCSVKDVTDQVMNSSVDHQWNIYLMGHGSSDVIAGFSINEFRDFLISMNSRRVNALIYGTCFGGGKNLREPYTQNNIPLRLNYAIASQCSRFSSSICNRYIDFIKIFHELDNRAAYHSWDECFQAAFDENDQQYGRSAFVTYVNISLLAQNFPWIRDPGDETFHLLSLPLYHAMPYTFADDQLPGEVTLTPELHSLLVQAPCVNRPINTTGFPSVISVADNQCHYLQSLTHPTRDLENILLRTFKVPLKEETLSRYLLGECRCMRNGRLHRFSNVRIENKPIGFWPNFMHRLKYGFAVNRPQLSKIITAEREDGKVRQTTINQKLNYSFDVANILKLSGKLLAIGLLGLGCRANAKRCKLSFDKKCCSIVEKLFYAIAALVPLLSWRHSAHVKSATGQLMWSDEYAWRTLSRAESQDYHAEFNRQHQELVDLAARQQAAQGVPANRATT